MGILKKNPIEEPLDMLCPYCDWSILGGKFLFQQFHFDSVHAALTSSVFI